MGRGSARRVGAALVALALIATACSDDDAAPDADPEAIVYAALGDSFSSGEGAEPYDAGTGSCYVGALAWPRRLYADVSDMVSVDHRACAGARTEHLTGPWDSRELPAQIPAEPDPEVTLVTLTIGGNDVGFGNIVGSCVIARCPTPDDAGLTERLATLVEQLTGSVYPALRVAYPEARIVHVGYPRLTPSAGEEVAGCGWLDGEDQARAAGILAALDDSIRGAADQSEHDVEYVDVTEALAGHELCSATPWLNEVGLGAGHAHPNAAGQRGLEVAVAEALGLDAGA